MDSLSASLANVDEVKINFQKVSGNKDTSGPFSSVNTPISLASPKPLSSNMDSRCVLSTKTPSFA